MCLAKTKATPLIIYCFISKPNYDTLDVLSKQKRTKGKIANFINSHGGIIHCAKHKLSKLAPAHHRKNFRLFSLSKPPQLFIKPVFHKVLNVKFTTNLRQISVCKDFTESTARVLKVSLFNFLFSSLFYYMRTCFKLSFLQPYSILRTLTLLRGQSYLQLSVAIMED